MIRPCFKSKNHIGDVFFCLFFALSPAGIVRKPEIELHWSTNELIATPYFNKVMPRNRFQLIWRFLQFRNPDLPVDAKVKKDGLYKVRPVLDSPAEVPDPLPAQPKHWH